MCFISFQFSIIVVQPNIQLFIAKNKVNPIQTLTIKVKHDNIKGVG